MKGRILLLLLIVSGYSFSQAILEDERYVPETDSLVLHKLEQWQDLKFGLLMHWGPYSQWSIVESWSICPEDYGWCERKEGPNPNNYYEYVQAYEGLKKTFNPVKFDPEKWAQAAKKAGMRYMIFTTKHHDGFSMFDSKYTDYKVTDPECAFSSNPRANITEELFDAFRAKQMWVGAYFSKPDWHHDSYWDPYWPAFDRNVNYDPALYPEKWESFVQFTHNQLLELTTDYGDIDIVWLDGGWVKKRDQQNLDENLDGAFDKLVDSYFRQALTDAIKTLPEREALVLSLYYDEALSLKEIGMVLSVSESRVSQIHSQALLRLKGKLRNWSNNGNSV